MTLTELKQRYDDMQKQYGDPSLGSIHFGGCMNRPDVCFVFMNPTGKNISAQPDWQGIRAPWIGTKSIWDLYYMIGKFDDSLYREIKRRKADEWTPDFARSVYDEIARNRLFFTNLGKCTLMGAKPVSDRVYAAYLPLLEQEISLIDPKAVVLFGNQVSTVFLHQTIAVTRCRRQHYFKTIGGKTYSCYPVCYPVGNGRVNLGKAAEDLRWLFGRIENSR